MKPRNVNKVILSGPISRFDVGKTDKYGTKTTFLVGCADPPIKVKVKTKYDQFIDAGRRAKSVLVTDGFMNGMEKTEGAQHKLITWGEARLRSVTFFYGTEPFPAAVPYRWAMVEGKVAGASGPWVTLRSHYLVPSNNEIRHRPVAVRVHGDFPGTEGDVVCAIGVPEAKANGQWFTHIEASCYWVLWK